MTELVKRFIEKNIKLIESGKYYPVFANAYNYLCHTEIEELLDVLKKALGEDLTNVATSVALNALEVALGDFKDDENRDYVELPSFIRLYMLNTCGVSYKDFESAILSSPPDVEGVTTGVAEDGTVYFEKIS